MKKVSCIGKNPSEEDRMSDKVVPLRAKEALPSDAPSEPGPKPGMGKLLHLVEERRFSAPHDFKLEFVFIPPADRKRRCSNTGCGEMAIFRLVWVDSYLNRPVPRQKGVYSCGCGKCKEIARRMARKHWKT
jgi:hypothetical protein